MESKSKSKYNNIDIWSVCHNKGMVKEQQRILDNLTTPKKCFTANDL